MGLYRVMMVDCKLHNSVSYFLNCSAWKSAIYNREQVKKYVTELSHLQVAGSRFLKKNDLHT